MALVACIPSRRFHDNFIFYGCFQMNIKYINPENYFMFCIALLCCRNAVSVKAQCEPDVTVTLLMCAE